MAIKTVKTHWDGATGAASGWLTVIDSCLFRVTADFSEGIEAWSTKLMPGAGTLTGPGLRRMPVITDFQSGN
jgi:hypothetical protein